MTKRTLFCGLGLSLAHLLLALALLTHLFGGALSRFDTGVPPAGLERLIDGALEFFVTVLTNAGAALHDQLPLEQRTIPVGWAIMVANSLLWGFGLLVLWRWARRRQ